MTPKNNYELLISKVDAFIRKYYVNQIIKGALLSTALIVALFIAFNLLEYYFYFEKTARKILFISFLGISGLAIGLWVLVPVMRYFRLGNTISHEQAAMIIGDHFSNVKDKLLNILQLKGQSDQNPNSGLLIASIEQKLEQISFVPFKKAIDLKKNERYIKYALPPLLLLFVILGINARLITDPATRIINNDQRTERPDPFKIELINEDLSVVQYDNYDLEVNVVGDILPNEMYVDVDNYQYRLVKENQNTFKYTFTKVQKELKFRLFSGEVETDDFTLKMIRKPNIGDFSIALDYPGYINRKDETIHNIGDLVVPQGTKLLWSFNAIYTDQIDLRLGRKEAKTIDRLSEGLFSYETRVMNDNPYTIFVSNEQLNKADSISYFISVVPDQKPSINVEVFRDSLDSKYFYFVGDANDDYGLRNLSFNYQVTHESGAQSEIESIPVQDPKSIATSYEYNWDLRSLALKPGDELSYYFEVYDNDAVNGSKSARTTLMTYKVPTIKELEQKEEENNNDIKEKLQKSLEETREIQEDLQKMKEKILQDKEIDWQDKKELEKMLDRQKQLEKEINQAKQSFEENIENQKEFSKTDEDILEKQEQIQKLFEESLSEEMQELMKQIEELMQELEKENALEMMEDMQMNDEELEMELDRMLELFKQLEVEAEMEKTIDKLEELAEKQDDLAEKTENNEDNQESLKDQQDKINEEFDDIQKSLEEIEKKNEALEQPKSLEDTEDEQNDIKQDLDESQEQLNNNNNKKASQKQKSAGQKMKEMAQGLSLQMQSQEMEQLEEDMAALRQLLENLVDLSFTQEDLIDNFNLAQVNTPHYTELSQHQFKLKDDFKLIQDSLEALSKRVFQIESFVTEKVLDVNRSLDNSVHQLEQRKKNLASVEQQRTMTSTNDLALMLSEVMNQMQQQMSGMMAGNQQCSKPGNKPGQGQKPSDKISEGQKSLGDQLQKMKNGQQGQGQGGSSEEFAKAAAKQSALRKALREKQRKLQQQGQGSKELQELIDQMNKNEIDLVNKNLTNELLKRQEQIMTRLLEHEKAERQRDLDDQRKSETAQEYPRKAPPSLDEYLKKRKADVDLLKSSSPNLQPYYKYMVEEYFKSLKSK